MSGVDGEELPVESMAVEAYAAGAVAALNLRRIVRRASGLSGASLVGSALAVAASFVAARHLGPNRYGDAQFVLLCYLYAGLVRSGIFEGAVRSLTARLAEGNRSGALRDQNVGVSFDMAVSLAPGLVLVAVGFFVSPEVRRLGLFLAPAAVAASSGSSYLSSLWSARDRFDVVGRVTLVRAVLGPAALVLLVMLIGTAGVFIAPVAADTVSLAAYLAPRPWLLLRAQFDWTRARALLRYGFPLGASAVVYWAYRLVGSTSVAVAGTAATLGAYTFAAAPVAVATRAIGGMQTVLMPAVWGAYSREGGGPEWARQAERLTVALAVIAGFAAALAQAAFAPVVQAAVPSFTASIRLFDILAITIMLLPMATIPSLVLDSERVNRQSRHLLAWAVALLVNAVANAAVLKSGLGAPAVAVNDAWVQLVVVVALFEMAAPHIWGAHSRRRFLLYARLLSALVVSAALTVAFDASASRSMGDRLDVMALVVRCAVACAAWVAVGAVLLRPWRGRRAGAAVR